jgi:hypothetical protein
MLCAEKDEELRKEYEAAIREYACIDLTVEEMERVIREKILPMAADAGFEFDPAELMQLLAERKAVLLTEDELEQA